MVMGLDSSAPHIARARQLVRERGITQVVTVEVGDLRAELPLSPASFDAVWTADVLYPDTVGDPAAVVMRLARVLKPGGILAIFYGNWLRPTYLPGYARLEHLICAARETLYTRERPWQGQLHPERPLAWLQAAGLSESRLHPQTVAYCQPLPDAVRQYITTAIFGGHYAEAVAVCGREVGMSAVDEDLWRRLSDSTNPGYLLNQPDYYCVLSPLLALGNAPA